MTPSHPSRRSRLGRISTSGFALMSLLALCRPGAAQMAVVPTGAGHAPTAVSSGPVETMPPSDSGPVVVNATSTAATVTVSASSNLATMPATGLGVNTAVWDGHLFDTAVPGLLQSAGIGMLRYPGGSTSDTYHWQTNSISTGIGGYANPNNTFDNFMGVVKKVGGIPVITINYGSNAAGTGGGDPAEAAAWVDYANNTKHYGIQYWEIGNELYGNGEYGSAWETDLHASHTPNTYGANVAAFSDAMKAKDPTIKVGVVLAAPSNWPDGVSPDWNSNVLTACGSKIDFVIVHWYPQNPGGESDSKLLAATGQVAAMVSKVRTLVNKYCGVNAANVQILTTETNSVSSSPGKQSLSLVNALFAADNLSAWLENGVTSTDWWALHNGSVAGNASSSLYGTTTYGDYGFLSNGSTGEPAAETPFAPYYGIQLAHLMAGTGDALLAATSSQSLLHVHAARRADGQVSVMLVNTSPTVDYTATVTVSGPVPYGAGVRYDYGPGSTALASSALSASGNPITVSVPAYTVSVLSLATVTPATDVSSSVQVVRGSYGYVRSTGHYLQSVTLTNTGAAVTGPVSLVLDGLTGGTVVKSVGTTTVMTPSGSPYVSLTAGMTSGGSASVVLEFAGQPKSYTTRVLAGSGTR